MSTPTPNINPSDALADSRVLAVVSGKGGSGKTMIATAMANIASAKGRVILVDADTGTAGLTYYLGLRMVHNTAVGLADMIAGEKNISPLPLQPVHNTRRALGHPSHGIRFLGVGNHRKLFKKGSLRDGRIVFTQIFNEFQSTTGQLIIVDCRGGIDADSIAVCELADDIIVVVEPDTTSFQASQHLVDVISDDKLAGKLRGFIVNKVFDDPSEMIRNGTAVFKCRCLSAVPFDIEATRAFLVGKIPSLDSQFSIQISLALAALNPERYRPIILGRPWGPEEFRKVSLSNPESTRGGLAIAALLLILMIALAVVVYQQPAILRPENSFITGLFIIAVSAVNFGLVGTLESGRRAVGKFVGQYVRWLMRLASGSRD